MPTLPELESHSPETLHEFLRWLTSGLGRYLGIATSPHHNTGSIPERIFALAKHIVDASRHTSDADLGVVPPLISDDASITDVVIAVCACGDDRLIAVIPPG